MIKWLGLCLTWGGCVLWGVQAGCALRRRVRIWEDLIQGLEQLRLELSLSHHALPELLERVAQHRTTRQGHALFEKCCARIEKGKSFTDAWNESLELVRVEGIETERLEEVSQVLGHYDAEQQVQSLLRLCMELGELSRREREKTREKCRVYGALGAAVGGFAALMLI